MNTTLKQLGALLTEMIEHHDTRHQVWKNIPLGKQAFALMQSLPDTLPGAFDTPADKAEVLGNLLKQMQETLTPRFCIQVRELIQRLQPGDEENERALQQLRDFIDPALPMEDYCRKYRRSLHFDPLERTAEWEERAFGVEEECHRRLQGASRSLGFCHEYWQTKREVLAGYGLAWRSPQLMNPRVRFD